MSATTITRRSLACCPEWVASTGETHTDELTIHYPCGDYETLIEPDGFAELAHWHRVYCATCAGGDES